MVTRGTKDFRRIDHLSNERTFLAWIRTNLGLMAFGFVVEKFSFFVEEIASILGKSNLSEHRSPHSYSEGYSSIFGIFLVGVGALFCIIAFMKFKRTERQINEDTYQSSSLPYTLLALFVFLVGLCLIMYLIHSHYELLPRAAK